MGTPSHRVLAARLANVGRIEEAIEVVAQLQALVPGLTVWRFGKDTGLRDSKYVELLLDGLGKAGLPA